MIRWLLFALVTFDQAWSASRIDAQFKVGKLKGSLSSKQEVSFLYKNVLARSMASRCRWYPSDSQYMNIVSRKCGSLRGTLFAFSRFMTEADAYRISSGSVIENQQLHFVDFPSDCDAF